MARSTDPTASPISAISEPDRVININVEGSRSLQRAGNVLDKHRRNFLQDSALLGAFALTGGALWRFDPALAQSGSGRELNMMSIDDLSHLLAGQKITSRQLVEQALAAIKDSQGEGPRTFLQVHENEALAAA